jgi:hypothetical protein
MILLPDPPLPSIFSKSTPPVLLPKAQSPKPKAGAKSHQPKTQKVKTQRFHATPQSNPNSAKQKSK